MAHYKNNIPVLFDIYDEAEHIHEDRTVFDGCIDMGGLPDSYLGVNVTCNGQHFHEIYENRTPGSLEFRIDYKHGWLYLNPTIYNGQKITLDYYSRGIELTPASRIYTFDANGCVDLKTTLQTYIDEINEGCKFTEANVPSSVDAFENIKSGESFSTMFGKIARWFTELKAHLKGSKWRHKSEHVDCKDNKTVQVKIDELEQSDEALGGRIDAETEERKKSDEDLQSSIAKEANARANADTALGGRIDDEIKYRAINDTRIETKIDDEIAERKSADQALEGKINTKIFDIEEKLEGKAAKGVVTEETMDTTFEPGVYYVVGYAPLTGTDATPRVLVVANSETSGQNGTGYQIYFCTGNENDPNIICYRNWDGKKWSDFEEFGSSNLMTDDLLKYLIGDVKVNYSISDFTVSHHKPYISFEITCDIYTSINGRDDWWNQQVVTRLPDEMIQSYPYTKYLYLTENNVIFSDDAMDTALNVFKKTFCLPLGKIVIQNSTDDGTYFLSKDANNPIFSQVIANKEVTADMFIKTEEDLTLIPEAIGALYSDKADFINSSNGFNAGDQSDASDGGGAIGRLAKTASGGAVGSEAESNNGFAGGYHVKVAGMGAAIGANASAYHGGAVGSGSQAGNGFAGGINAKCGKAPNGEDVDCIQLGAGTNGSEKTLQVYGYQLLDKNGYIPNERMEKGTLKNPKVVSETELNKTWQPGWYLCNFNSELVPTEGILRGQQLVQVINETYIDENGVTEYDVIQFIYDVGGIGYCRDAYNDSVNSFDKVLDGDSFSNWEHSRINNDVTSLKAEIETLKAEIQELKANFIKNGDKVVIDANGDE